MRPYVPGDEYTFSNIMDPNAVHDRTIRCWAATVNPDEGYVTLDFDAFPSVGRAASIPWLWASFPDAEDATMKRVGAWGRYVPFPSDLLKVSFDYDDKPHVVGYDTKAYSDNSSANECGWGKLVEISAGDDPYLLSQFRVLQSGEYDFMSIGGAYIYGSAAGQLHLEGGPAQINLEKASNSINSVAQCWMTTAGSSTIRYGQVRRFVTAPTPFGVGEISMPPWNPDGSYVEHQVYLQNMINGIGFPLVRHALGNVTTNPPLPAGGGIPDVSTTTGQIKRFALDVFAPGGVVPVYNNEVDALGSQSVTALTATQFNLTYPAGTVKYTSKSANHIATVDYKITAGTTFDLSAGTTITGRAGTSIEITAGTSFKAAAAAASNIEAGAAMTLKAGAAMALTGATLSLTGGGMSITMPGGGFINLGGAGATSSSLKYTPFNTAVSAATITFDTSMTPAISAFVSAGLLPPTSSAVGAALTLIQTWIDAVAAALSASANDQVRL